MRISLLIKQLQSLFQKFMSLKCSSPLPLSSLVVSRCITVTCRLVKDWETTERNVHHIAFLKQGPTLGKTAPWHF